VTLGNTGDEIGGLTISDPPTQAEVPELRHKTEDLASDLRNLSTLIHSLRTALVAEGLIKGGA
jgi:hypothetical protein